MPFSARSSPRVARSSSSAARLLAAMPARAASAAWGSVRSRYLGDAGLGVDDGDVVGEDVVQLVGDADALGRDLAVGLGLPAVLGGLGPLFGGGDPLAPLAGEEAQHGGTRAQLR